MTPVKHGPRGMRGELAEPPLERDTWTGCAHRTVEVYGVYQCSRCMVRLDLVEVDGRIVLRARKPLAPPPASTKGDQIDEEPS